MDEIREAALAYYANLPESMKQQAWSFFRSLDRNGDGKIDVQEYTIALNRMGITWMNNLGFFKELDRDGNGTLDFDEVITLFYLKESGRSYFCDGCRAFLKGVYFTCLTCFNSGPATCSSFDLCCSCYRNNNFNHHHHATSFVDNYVLLQSIWRHKTVSPMVSNSSGVHTHQVPKTMDFVAATSNTVSASSNAAFTLFQLFENLY
ncbi:Calcium-binding EF-hand [Corchorus capsularis]|uniref:Calcium-binding EF-hand n=1 Tax=Corchorus capsularis TaxID=210143 RepID=A0A1R3JKB1_COCAP|nr:Calcium-binding EF-hand [Corchorus capsularis]